MTTRLFSILRRKPGLIDFVTQIRPESDGVFKYRLKTDTDPGGAFSTTVIESRVGGFVDPSVAGPQNVIQPGNNVRIVFNPFNYSLTDSFFWLKLVYVNASNVEMVTPAPSAATLVLPPYVGNEQSGFSAMAPNGSDISQSLQIDLPRQMDNIRVRNLGAPTGGGFSGGSFDSVSATPVLYVSFQEFGPEVAVLPGVETVGFSGIASSIWVRADGAQSGFTVQFRYANPP
jgi:hypothetical protein